MRRPSHCAISVIAAIAMCAVSSGAQQAPADTSTTDFMVGHVHVILRRNTANDVIAANVYLLGGTRRLTPETAGIEALMLAASDGGTKRFPRTALRAITARTGASIVIDPAVDWTEFGLRTLRSSFDSSWAAFADRLVAPRLDSADVGRARAQLLSEAVQSDADPDAAVARLADSLLYVGHPYRLNPAGTVASLSRMTPTLVRAYHDTGVVQSRLLVIVVGNIERSTAERAIRATIATLPIGGYTWTPPPLLTPVPRSVAVESKALPTNYILGYYAGPRAGTADYDALRIATAVLSGRLFAEVRSRQHLAYAVDAPFMDHAVSAGGFYVTTTDPTAALGAMADELHDLQTTLVAPDGLQTLVGQFITDYFLKNETNADQASFLARAELYDGSYRRAADFVADLRKVTPQDIQRVAAQYMHGTDWGFVGDTTKVPRILTTRF